MCVVVVFVVVVVGFLFFVGFCILVNSFLLMYFVCNSSVCNDIKFIYSHIAPDPVRSLSAITTSSSIDVSWDVPLCPYGVITGYNLYYREGNIVQTGTIVVDDTYSRLFISSSSSSPTSQKISNLPPFRNYTIIVRAMVGNNDGEIREEIIRRTLSNTGNMPTLETGVATSQPHTRTQVTYLIPDPRQINTGVVM